MRIPTRDIPQADKLSDALRVVDLVAGGVATYQDISGAFGKVERQARYYRRAAEILGFIGSTGRNTSVLTGKGKEYIRSIGSRKRYLLLQAVIGTRIFQRIIPFLESKMPNGCKPDDFRAFLENVTETAGESMMPRRASTLIGWLKAVDLVVVSHDRYVLCVLPKELHAIPFHDESEPLLPTKFSLSEYRDVEEKASASTGTILYTVDETKRERASNSHRMLTNLVASRVRDAGAIPRYNDLVDLAARIRDMSFIFEMKSTNATNIRNQIRRGVSQLYEYRFLQNAPDAQLVLVIENPLGKEIAWMSEYLLRDRGILLAWDGDRKNLHCPSPIKETLGFLVP